MANSIVIPGQCEALNPEPRGKHTALSPPGFRIAFEIEPARFRHQASPSAERSVGASGMTKWLALIAFALLGGCSSLRFEPTANWLSAGGQICAASYEAPFSEFDRAAPRSCTLASAGAKRG
jgi:hypothetical protein